MESIIKSVVTAFVSIIILALITYFAVGGILKDSPISANDFFFNSDAVVEELMRMPELD